MGKTTTKVWRETVDRLRQKAGITQIGLSAQMGYSSTWYNKKFEPGYAELRGAELILMCKNLNCTEEELKAIPVSGQAQTPADDGGSLLEEVQALTAIVASGINTAMKDRATGSKQDELYDMIRGGFKLLHKDLEALLQLWKGEGSDKKGTDA